MKSPTAAHIRRVRRRAGLSQAEAAALVHLSAQPRWSMYETGTRQMPAARWELFLIKLRSKLTSK